MGAITAFHVIEHLDWKTQLRVFTECFRVLADAGVLILEWPNIDNLYVAGQKFWMDPTHIRPLPATLVSFMVEYVGFRDVSTITFWGCPPIEPADRDGDYPEITAPNALLTPGRDIALIVKKLKSDHPNALAARQAPSLVKRRATRIQAVQRMLDRHILWRFRRRQ